MGDRPLWCDGRSYHDAAEIRDITQRGSKVIVAADCEVCGKQFEAEVDFENVDAYVDVV